MNLRVKIKRVKDVELPKYAKPGDSGFDLVAAEDTVIYPGKTTVIPTGLAFEIPPGYELQVRPRSGISRKTFLRVVLGTVDSGYRSEVGIIAENMGEEAYEVTRGDRIAQGVIAPVMTACFVEADELSKSERGGNGFGSTGIR
ncbi:deoxyuridine 5'-triphosphate nucleotidohydrolase [Bacillus sp. N35-10-4]|uniref:dUTP diphosphatase n=1 Tax=Bacillus sp. N35-10-4 TaxID=1866315 RepID=UPI0008FE6F32|nr:dUTP diphosphatase [Bacillus sp. N35-10-4]OJD66231.1 deoxyuridine 5'-triphosphate nucleotidohydrolase [Bacillus sp. N35-10-4]